MCEAARPDLPLLAGPRRKAVAIPNSVVKRLSGDDNGCASDCENTSLPDLLKPSPKEGFFFAPQLLYNPHIMANSISMADLLARQEFKGISLTRGQEVTGEVVEILPQEVILDLGTKSEGVLQKKDIPAENLENLKVGVKIQTFVIYPENESGQVVLGLHRATRGNLGPKWDKFEDAYRKGQALSGKGLEINKGGLVVEVAGMRGFLPSSQIALSQAANPDELVGKDIEVRVIEVDPKQNRLIFSQKVVLSDNLKTSLAKVKAGDKVKGKVAALMPFGVFVSFAEGLEGLAHVSELSWEKVEDPNSLFKVGDEVEAKVLSADLDTGRVNLSIKQLQQDPFAQKAKDFQPDDIIKGKVTKVTSQGVSVELEGEVEGFVPQSKLEPDSNYAPGQSASFIVDTIDTQRRRVNLAPFLTSTKDLIYK